MIAQVLHRDTVLAQAADATATLAELAAPERRADPLPAALRERFPELEALTTEDFAFARDALAASRATELAESSGQTSFPPPPAERRGEESAPLDDFAFFSRDAVMSNLQSALEASVEATRLETPERDERRGNSEDVAVTDTAVAGFEERRGDDNRRVLNKFSVTDPRWVSSLVAMGLRRLRKPFPFPDRPAPIRKLGANARVILVGDWGSGIPRAQKVAAAIRRDLDAAAGRDRHVVHLGDVYYSGWAYEYRSRFLDHWPVREDERDAIGSWNLNGNHDMYSGGHDYFGVSLTDPRFAKYHQGSSYFRLESEHWQVFGLDTAYEDHGLAGDQGGWVHRHVTAAENAGKKNLLLSHHQIFSAYERGSNEGGRKTELRKKIAPALASGRVTSWFWGHEHRCALYRQGEDGVGFARCLGHGGVPVYMSREPGDPVADPAVYEFRRRFTKGLEHWARFGYAVLDFAGGAIEVSYRDEDGQEDHHERIE